MRRALILAILFIACRGKQAATISPHPPRVREVLVTENVAAKKVNEPLAFDRSMVVERSAIDVEPNKPVVLTMWLKESPGGLQTRAEWLDARGHRVFEELKPMHGEKVASFALPKKVKAGHYRVVGYWGGNIAAEHEFDVARR
ncbi:MAG TPA: hypothetical protein VMU84_22050 [Thermoanaerobaculia bacterium]|nr:hypothetical protein [Thermoanaerobaculia bacterium]